MHACDLLELAVTVATHGNLLIETSPVLSQAGLENYWAATKARHQRWSLELKSYSLAVASGTQPAQAKWPLARATMEEILLTETLTRVWCAVLKKHDGRLGRGESEPIGQSILSSHIEARHRVMTLLLHGPSVSTTAAVELNRLRLRIERWTDMLIASVLHGDELYSLAFDAERAAEFSEEYHAPAEGSFRHQAWQLTLAAIRAAFRPLRQAAQTENTDLNAQIAAAILACFPSEAFDATGVLRSLWVVRLTNGTSDTAGLIDELMRLDAPGTRQIARPRRS
jgi:hypothetical protein